MLPQARVTINQHGVALMRSVLLATIASLALTGAAFAEKPQPTRKSAAAQIDYKGFSSLTGDVSAYRQKRLIGLDRFKQMAREPNTIILDARSAYNYARGHIKGAVNLPFTDFTADSLRDTLGPNRNVRILIYCNNNFVNDAAPVVLKSAPLALNIPTFINLVGYGYKNVYELGDVIDFNESAVEWVTSAP
jgi:rhodanese-related sulfurtransferase